MREGLVQLSFPIGTDNHERVVAFGSYYATLCFDIDKWMDRSSREKETTKGK
jgi:hypothetical protein